MTRFSPCHMERLLVSIMLLACLDHSIAQSGNAGGRSGAQFLEIGVGARASAMGESFIAVTNDISACYYNPSGLVSINAPQAMFTFINLPADIKYNFAAIGTPVSFLNGTISFQMGQLSTGEMSVTTPLHPEGTGQTFEVTNLMAGFSYARSLTDKFSFGVTVKYIGLNAFKYEINSIAMDLGSVYRTGFKSFRFAWSISNFGPDAKFIDEEFSLPTMITFGAAAEIIDQQDHVLTASFQANRPNDNDERLSIGGEYSFRNVVILRGGYKVNYDSDRLSFGVGVAFPFSQNHNVRFDYSYSEMNHLNKFDRYSLTIDF